MISVIGLAMIIAGWIVQVYKTSLKKDETVNPLFLLLYVIGVGLLVSGSFLENNIVIGILNRIGAACVIRIFQYPVHIESGVSPIIG